MKIKNPLLISFIFIIIIFTFLPSIIAADIKEEDKMFLGLELDKLLSFINGIIALLLFIITFISYKRDGRSRLLYISVAFLIFSIKSFLVSSELFNFNIIWIDPLSIILELLVLLFFFYGVIKKGG